MAPRKIILIIVALAAGIGAFVLMRSALSDSANANNQPVVELEPIEEIPQVDVLISLRNIQVGETVSENDLSWVSWNETSVSPDQITRRARPEAIAEVSGQIVLIPIYQREAIVPQKIVKRGETGVMAAIVTPGMRAVAIEISVESASGGFILPDDRVDIILTREVEINTGEGIEEQVESLIILENVRVLAIDQGISVGSESPTRIGSTATIELSQEDSSALALAARTGRLSLALRSLQDFVQSGDEVTSHTAKLVADAESGQVALIKNGRKTLVSAGRGE